MKGGAVVTEIIEPYAQALMSLAQSHDLTGRFGEDANFLLELLESSEDLRQFLASPLVKADDRKAVLRRLAGEQVHPFMLSFLMLLVDRGRILFLDAVCQKYQELLRKFNQIVLAEVVAAVDLNDEQKEAVRQKVRNLTGAREVELSIKLDPELIGGVIIRVGSQVIDASLRDQLRRIGMRLSSATV